MKKIYLFTAFLFPLFIIAQVPDYSETDCNGITRSIYAVGDAGKPLIIASKGFDCSICMGQAGSVRNFANDNLETIEVWGAMTYIYSSAVASCTPVNEWVETYDWNNIFTFSDVDEIWLEEGTPRYYVIHPESHTIAYEGSNFNSAANTALGLVTVTGLNNAELNFKELSVYSDGEMLQATFGSDVSGNAIFEILNIVGQQSAVFNMPIVVGSNRFNQGFSAAPGIYIFKVTLNGQITTRKFVVTGN